MNRFLAQKECVGWILALIPVGITDRLQGRRHQVALVVGHLQPSHDPAIGRAVVAVVEHGNIPAPPQIFGTTDTCARFEDLEKSKMGVRNVNTIKYETIPSDIETVTKIRYKDPGTLSTIKHEGTNASVLFHKNVSAVAPGQSAVFYEGDDVLGGGFIMKEVAA